MKNYNNFIVERLGVSDPVYQVSKRIYDYLLQNFKFGKKKFDAVFPKELYSKELNKVLKFNFQYRPKSKKKLFGYVSVNVAFSGEIEGNHCDYYECVLVLAVKPELSKIVHEIQHVFEYTSVPLKDGKFFHSNDRNLYYNVPDENMSSVSYLLYNIYLSLPDEMNSRVQEFYHKIKDKVSTLEEFKDEVVNSKEYGYAKDMKEMGENFIEASKENSDVCMDILNSVKMDQKQFNELLIDTPNNLLRKAVNYFISNLLPKIYKVANEKEAIDFIGKWGHIFSESGEKWIRRLWRLWDLIEDKKKSK